MQHVRKFREVGHVVNDICEAASGRTDRQTDIASLLLRLTNKVLTKKIYKCKV